MATSAKGKEKVIDGGKGSSGKRKRNNSGGNDDDRTAGRKRKNRGVIQFFEDAAYEVNEDDDSDDSFFDDDFLEDEFDTATAAMNFQKNEPSRAPFIPVVPKEEEPTEEELEKMLQERYKPGSTFVTYAEDSYESKRTMEKPEYYPSVKDPIIWKVKCMVGRERHSAFCLMQKYVDLQFLGKKLQIISAFALDHVKGYIYIEAEKQCDINEACNGLCGIYLSRVAPVQKDDISHLFSVRNKGNGITEGMWARVKNGKYKGDLAQVVAVNDGRRKVTVKLIPRIDLQALAEKFGRGITPNRAVNPAPRLISSSEIEEFRPLIQCRRDRDTNKVFEVLDGMMLKDGYLYKKVSIDSLSFWGATPTDDELLKFEPSKNDDCNDLEWLSQLYGERKNKRPLISDKGGGKGEGSSTSIADNDFEVHDLVFFGRKDFGVIIGTEKDESFKIIKAGSEGPVVVTIPRRELKNASFDKKLFTALDQQMKNVSINDRVKVINGPLKDREGIVKRIYRGIIFLYNETVEENNGYMCFKAQMCEKVELPGEACNGKGGEPGPTVFGDFASSPKSPLSPKQFDQGRDGSRNFNREDNAMYSVGQSLRIRVGPLKGYLCRVLAIRRSDVTVKLDSQHKILTVKCEHLAEVRAKSSGISLGEESDALKPFDLLGTQDGSTDWLEGTAKAAEAGSWNAEGFSTERSSWPGFPASNFSLQTEPQSSNPPISVNEDANKGDSSWEAKPGPGQGPSWGAAAASRETTADGDQVGGWGNQEDSSKKDAISAGLGSSASDSWGKAVESIHPTVHGLKEDSWGRVSGNLSIKDDSSGSKSAWNTSEDASAKPTVGWGNAGGFLDQPDANAWKKATTSNERQTESRGTTRQGGEGAGGWGKGAGESAWVTDGGSSWNKQDGGSLGNKQGGGSSWNKPDDAWNKGEVSTADQASGWRKGASDVGRPVDSASWEKRETPDENSESLRKISTTSLDGNQSSAWGSRSNWDTEKGSIDKKSSWGQKSDDSKMDVEEKKDGAWNTKKTSDGGSTSGWGQSKWTGATDAGGGSLVKKSSWGQKSDGSKIDLEADKGSAWNSKKTSEGGSTSGWGQSKCGGATDAGGGSSSGWGQSKWGGATDAGGGSSSGWGQSKWSGATDAGGGLSSGCGQNKWSGETDAGGKQNPWSSKSNWSSDNNFGSNEEQKDTFDDKGRSGNWRGGRGGRWGQDRGGFGGRGGSERYFEGRGGSDRGGFGGRGRSDRGGFGGRGRSDRSDFRDFGGRGGSDRGGFRGRGGFGGRGRGRRDDWNKDDSGEDKPYSWNNTSKKDVDWKSTSGGGNWNNGDRDKGQWQSGNAGWAAAGGGDSAQAGGWNKGSNSAGGSDAQARGWNRAESNWKAKDVASGDKSNSWKNGSSSNADGWASNNSGGNWQDGDKNQCQGTGSDYKKSKEPTESGDIEQAGGWTRGLSSSKDHDKGQWKSGSAGSAAAGGGDSAQAGGWNKGSSSAGGSDAQASGWNRAESNWKAKDVASGDKSNSWKNGSSSNADGLASNNSGGKWQGGDKYQWQGAGSDWKKSKEPTESGDIEQAGGWTRGLSSSKDRDKGQWQSGNAGWAAAGGGDSAKAGGWNKGSNSAGGSDAQASGWNRADSNWKAKDVASGDKANSWKNKSSSNADRWASNNSGGNWQGGDKNEWQGAGSDWKKSKEPTESGDIQQAGGWTSGLSSSKDRDKGHWQSGNAGWAAAGGGDSAQAGGWNKGSSSAGGSDAQSSGWNRAESNWKAKDVASGDKANSWKNGSSSNADRWASNNSGGNWQGGDKNQWQGAGSDWKKSKEPTESGDVEQAGGWTRGLSSSKDDVGSDTKPSSWNGKDNNWKTSNSSGGATSSSWNQPATDEGEGAGTGDAWGKAAASSSTQARDGNDKGGW